MDFKDQLASTQHQVVNNASGDGEFYPYGSTSYQAAPGAVEVSPKRYRYTGKERDEETGFYCCGARYIAP